MVCSLGRRTQADTHCGFVQTGERKCSSMLWVVFTSCFLFYFLLSENHTCIRVFLLSRKVQLPLLTFLPKTLYASTSM